MARGTRRWGALCPVDGGLLLEGPDWGDRLWCPSNGHGGNGQFFVPSQTTEGYEMAQDGSGLTEAQKAALAAKASGEPTPISKAKSAKEKATSEPKAPKAAKAPAAVKEPRACECECGGTTKGGRFLPGHDAKLHARQKAEAKAKAELEAAVQ